MPDEFTPVPPDAPELTPTDHVAEAVIHVAPNPYRDALQEIASLEWASERSDAITDLLRKAQHIAKDALTS